MIVNSGIIISTTNTTTITIIIVDVTAAATSTTIILLSLLSSSPKLSSFTSALLLRLPLLSPFLSLLLIGSYGAKMITDFNISKDNITPTSSSLFINLLPFSLLLCEILASWPKPNRKQIYRPHSSEAMWQRRCQNGGPADQQFIARNSGRNYDVVTLSAKSYPYPPTPYSLLSPPLPPPTPSPPPTPLALSFIKLSTASINRKWAMEEKGWIPQAVKNNRIGSYKSWRRRGIASYNSREDEDRISQPRWREDWIL